MDRQQRLDGLLNELTKEGGVLGIALVSRDGLAVGSSGKLSLSRETFSAMAATTMGAAEIAIAELDGGKAHHLIAVTDRVKLIILGVTRDLLLVACTQADASHDQLLPRLESAAQNVALVVSGG
jgi:predicted regulator of Ras-like GTPase activity (Roadblock/LC7/MglB family)